MRAILRRLRYVFRRSDHDAELRDEIESHRAHRQDALERDGLAPTDAAWASRRAMGNVTLAIEDAADVWIVRVLDSVQQDIRDAVRGFRKRAGVSAVIVGTLALGIGANTAIFSVVNAVSLRPLPYPDANRIYLVRRTGNAFGGPSISMPIFLGWQQAQHGVFEHLALVGWRNPTTVTGSGEADRIAAAAASTELFAVLGVRPALGRAFLPEEGRPGGPSVVVISDRLWRARFHGDSRVLGTTMTLDNDPSTIVGVLPADFALPVSGGDAADVWFPFRVPRTSSNPSNGGTLCLALLRADVSQAQAEALLTPPLAELRREFPNMFSAGERARLQPFRDFIAASAGPAPLLLFGAAVLVLLIACANVANLTMAASAVRQRELAVRAAIGAGRGRIVRQLLTESLLLAMIGGSVGVALCYAGFDAIVALVPPTTPHVGDFSIDGRVLFFALLLSLATGLLFGIVPALGATNIGADAIVRRVNPSVGGRGRLRAVLAANEIAISVVLLIAAGLALQSFGRLLRVEPGFDYSRALTARVSIPPHQYATPAVRAAFFRDALDRLAALPGVERAALASRLPLQPGGDLLFSFEGPHPGSLDDRGAANFRFVSPQYFDALRVGLARGRVFSDADNSNGKPVVLINRALARRAWADSDPSGS
jgi:predicted permease